MSDDETRAAVLVDAVTLAAALAGDEPPVLLDVRWALGRTDGHEQYLEGHVPGAVYVDLDAELAALAVARRAAGVAQPTEPLYLRRPDAVPSAGSKRVG